MKTHLIYSRRKNKNQRQQLNLYRSRISCAARMPHHPPHRLGVIGRKAEELGVARRARCPTQETASPRPNDRLTRATGGGEDPGWRKRGKAISRGTAVSRVAPNRSSLPPRDDRRVASGPPAEMRTEVLRARCAPGRSGEIADGRSEAELADGTCGRVGALLDRPRVLDCVPSKHAH